MPGVPSLLRFVGSLLQSRTPGMVFPSIAFLLSYLAGLQLVVSIFIASLLVAGISLRWLLQDLSLLESMPGTHIWIGKVLTLTLDRDDWNEERVLGSVHNAADNSLVVADTLELPWKSNLQDVSCIPLGTYLCEKRWSPEHNCDLYWITGVKDREDVEIHWGNYPSNSKGCVLVGQAREADAIDNSKAAFASFMQYTAGVEQFTLVVQDVSTQGGAHV